jgi:PKD repeat protein
MKKASLAIMLFGLTMWLCGPLCGDLYGQNVTIVTPGPISVGQEVHLRFDHEGGGGASASYSWNFGDGSVETTNNNQAHHAFSSAGTFTVSCMFTNMGAPPVSGTATVTVVDNRRVSPQGSGFRVGRRVNFQADNFAGSTLTWNFGDGASESGPRNHGHVYGSQGSFQVKAHEPGSPESTAVSCQVMIEADNRRLDASPGTPRANQAVAFTAQNFAGGGLHWDYGDGGSDNGGPNQSHVYSQAGNFHVRAWESSGTADDAVSMALTVVPDNRQVQASPAPPRAGMEVRFTASNFAGGSLRWSFGDGKTENGGPAMSHVYAAPGNVQLQVWEESQGPENAWKTSLSVQPDFRQLTVGTPFDIFDGSDVVFECRNFSSNSLRWDFGDGTVERGNMRQVHRFQRPGNYLVKVVEDGTDNLPLEKRIQVLNDNRGLVLRTSTVFANSEFEIEAQNFRGSSISWDFGDGRLQSGPRLMKHRYASSGQYRVRVVDFAGRDGKFVEKIIQVENDSRVIRMPVEIIAGEEIALQLQNAGLGSFTWKFSDGDTRSGPELRAKAFRSPGPHKITVADSAGKYPPLEKTVQVLPDTRSLKSSSGFILPKEAVTFTAWNFRGPGVRWDFGDGTVKENGQVTEKHEYAALGRYQVKAVDFNGRSSKVFRADVVVAEMIPGFEISALEFAFDTGKYYRVVTKNGPAPGYQLRIKARGRGVLTGQFMLDNMSIGLFQLLVQENQASVLPKAQMSALPMSDLGLHELTLKFTNYSFNRRIPIIKYFVSAAGAIQIVSPLIDAKVPVGDKVTLRWAIERKKPLFEIAVSEVPFQFLDDRQVTWLPLAGASTHLFDPAPYKPGTWIYWQVRLLNESRQVQTTSEIASFKLSE